MTAHADRVNIEAVDTRLLKKLLSLPTAPFREQQVIGFIQALFKRHGVLHFQDPSGNLVVGVNSLKEYRSILSPNKRPLFVFIAHLDHPGFHGVKWSGRRLGIQWYGGSPNRLLNGARVWACGRKGPPVPGILGGCRLTADRTRLHTGEVIFEGQSLAGLASCAATQIYGGFRFRCPVWVSRDRIYTKAADDLVGVFAILSLAIHRKRHRNQKANFLGLLTRAEEVGFIGTLEHLRYGWLTRARREIICVSLESSRALPGARVGNGPVVRLGDRATVFDTAGTQHLTQIAQKTLGGRYQRRIMDGGTCEGTATAAHGLKTIALSVPLGNYHNQSFEGGPDSRGPFGPAPEFVHLGDVSGMIRVCSALLDCPMNAKTIWSEKLRGFNILMKKYGALIAP